MVAPARKSDIPLKVRRVGTRESASRTAEGPRKNHTRSRVARVYVGETDGRRAVYDRTREQPGTAAAMLRRVSSETKAEDDDDGLGQVFRWTDGHQLCIM